MARKITKKNEQLTTLFKLPPEVTVDHIIQHSASKNEFVLTHPTPISRQCPSCGSTDCVIKDSHCSQTISHMPYDGTSILITYDRRRLLCRSCSTTFYQTPDWILSQLRMSKLMYLSIFQDLTTTFHPHDCTTEMRLRKDSIQCSAPHPTSWSYRSSQNTLY